MKEKADFDLKCSECDELMDEVEDSQDGEVVYVGWKCPHCNWHVEKCEKGQVR